MKRQASAAVLLFFFSGLLAFGFTNCSNINFQKSQASVDSDTAAFLSTSSILIDNGASYSNQKSLQLSLISPRAVSMKISTQKDCSDGTWEAYANLQTVPVTTPDQTITWYAQYKDILSNISDCVSDDIVHDDQPPTATFLSAPNMFIKDASTSLKFTASDSLSGVDSVNCWDNAGAPQPCTSSILTANKTEGSNSVRLNVKDKAGNISPDVVYTYVFDKTPPNIKINSKPASITGSTSAQLAFSGDDAISGVASYSCLIDGKAGACASPISYASLSEGSHHFEVTATDKAGNVSVAAVADWKVDLTAPSIMLTQTPNANSNLATATFAYTATDDGQAITAFQCRLDGAAYASCPSPKSYTGLSNGTHTFQVTATDTAGNQSQPATFTWLIDTVAPVVVITSGPSGLTNNSSANFAWTATDSGSGIKTVKCMIDGGSAQACDSLSISLSGLKEGNHSITVTATDLAGNTGSATRAWSIDLTPPVLTISSHPDGVTAASAANFAFSATDVSGISLYECKLDTGSYAACTSPKAFPAVTDGTHIFYVRATDKAGNVSAVASYSWLADLAPPLIIINSAPATVAQGSAAAVQYSVIDSESGLASVTCQFTTPSSAGTASACDAVATVQLGTLTTVGTYTLQITGTDKVGNVAVENVTIQVTAKPVICDPFNPAAEKLCNGGLLGNIYYLTGSGVTAFNATAGNPVDYFYTNGIKVDNFLNLSTLNVPERSFTSGFPSTSGNLLVDNSGNTLIEYFAFRLSTIVKLDPTDTDPNFNKAGWYQFATLSDDGSIVNYQPTSTAASQTLVSNDGLHSVRMGCSSNAIYISDTSRMPFEIKYFQGPRTDIGLILLWKKVASQTAALDANCGVTDRTGWFGPNYGDYSVNYLYGQITITNGWRVMGAGNFIAPATVK